MVELTPETQSEGDSEPDEPTYPSEAPQASDVAETGVDEIELSCAVCHEPIPAGEEFVKAAYGPVHPAPCSHQGATLVSETTELDALEE